MRTGRRYKCYKNMYNFVKLCQKHENITCFSCFAFKSPTFKHILEKFAQMCVCTSAPFRNSVFFPSKIMKICLKHPFFLFLRISPYVYCVITLIQTWFWKYEHKFNCSATSESRCIAEKLRLYKILSLYLFLITWTF